MTAHVDYIRVTVTYTTAALTITTASPLAGGTVGTAYSQTLTASGGTPSYTWSIASGSLPAGLTLEGSTGAITGTPTAAGGPTSITFRVTDSAAAIATKALSITVSKITPVITWGNPADITYGTALSGTQLNATASVAGMFVYSPASGTLLPAGSGQALHVDFTPSDTANYNSASADVAINVTPRALTVTADNRGKNYGDTVTFAGTEFTTVGLINSDTVASVTLTSAGADAWAAIGTYPIVPSAATGTGLANYSITYANGTLTVSSLTLTITANNRSKTYGNTITFAGTEFTVAGLLAGDTVDSVTLTSAGAGATGAAGTWNIVPSAATGTGLAKYTITYVNGTLTVNPKALTVTANNRAKTQGETVTFAGTEFTAVGPGELRRRHQRDPDQRRGRGLRPQRRLPHHPQRRYRHGPGQLQHHLCQRHPDREHLRPDHHRQQRQQDLRRHGHLRRHRVHRHRPARRGLRRQRHPDQRRGRGHRRGRRLDHRPQRRHRAPASPSTPSSTPTAS